MNVTAVTDASGNVLERYAYDPYGRASVVKLLNGAADKGSGVSDWSADADGLSDVDNAILFCGYYRDAERGLYQVRRRMYQPLLGRWLQHDPLGYVDGRSLYEYACSRPWAGIR